MIVRIARVKVGNRQAPHAVTSRTPVSLNERRGSGVYAMWKMKARKTQCPGCGSKAPRNQAQLAAGESQASSAPAPQRSVPAANPVEHMVLGQPVMHHAFAVVLLPVGARFKNRQPN